MRKKWSRSLIAVTLAVGMFLAIPVWALGKEQPLDLTKKCSLKVIPGTQEDIANAEVIFDLYKVADAVEDPETDAYLYDVTEAYASLGSALSEMEALDSESWHTITEQAADITLKQGAGTPKAVDGADGESAITDLDSGLYLLIARGAGLENYVATDENGELVTLAYSDDYMYSFKPELISLPGTVETITGEVESNGERQEINTGVGEWEYDVFAFLKPVQTARYGSLEIVKNLPSYETTDPATFVFQVEGYKDATKAVSVYSDVVSISFETATQKKVLIEDKIPAGAYVEVTEVYSGASYSVTTQPTQTAVIEMDKVATVSFTNSYNGGGNNGGAITNHFEYSDTSGWGWNQIKDTTN